MNAIDTNGHPATALDIDEEEHRDYRLSYPVTGISTASIRYSAARIRRSTIRYSVACLAVGDPEPAIRLVGDIGQWAVQCRDEDTAMTAASVLGELFRARRIRT